MQKLLVNKKVSNVKTRQNINKIGDVNKKGGKEKVKGKGNKKRGLHTKH